MNKYEMFVSFMRRHGFSAVYENNRLSVIYPEKSRGEVEGIAADCGIALLPVAIEVK